MESGRTAQPDDQGAGTREGLPAVEQLIADGLNINITLLFGLPRYQEVAEAYLAGLESLVDNGKG